MLPLDEEHRLYAATVDTFAERQVRPQYDEWERAGLIDRAVLVEAGKQGLLGLGVPAEFGGPGVDDYLFNVVLGDRLARALVPSFLLTVCVHNDVVLPYLLRLASDEQRSRWLPGTVSGETLLAIAMTEPGTGSDLAGIRTSARRDGDTWVIDGAKTFITNGQLADLVIVAARTSDDPHRGLTLFAAERDMAGFQRGRNLDKVGLHAQDTSELFFDEMRVPDANRLGEVGGGFTALVSNLPQERLSIAIGALAAAEAVFELTLEYVQTRTAFGQPIGSFQHNRFVLAEMRTELDVARSYLDERIVRHCAGQLSAVDAAAAKWWCTELQVRIVDRCVQLHGGYGYMREYAIARAFTDARVQTIYGGTTEIMKEIVGRSLGL